MIRGVLRTCHGYLRLLIFMAALLAGLQLPAFIHHYENTLLAHLSEARQSLQPFLQDARVHTGGDLNKLIERYRQNADTAIRDGGNSLQALVKRHEYLQNLADRLSESQLQRIWYGLFDTDPVLFSEARQHYDYQITLNGQAIGWGLISGLLIMMFFDLFCGLCALPFRGSRSV
ncbi:DUF2937 family protein [Lacimicrobium alkaliphilum]|uniref:DUF2937 domain-containing protein n=1 Tax=Lacimicrobium alkaliphilum TaxID=1526571 RepID=A0A0U3AKV1_9ALTE|nr:DUF2937 family protein [Lacimicrobium alkaliphilum]ALS98594.1 hypothetical protein AT746_10165 [Lacimicrobium alkaliphilum]